MMKAFPDPNRCVLAMEGADVEAVLQGTVSNDVAKASEGAVYAALLTPQGKYLFDFFVMQRAEGRWLIDVASDRAEELARRIKMYCLRRDARITGDSRLSVTLVWGDRAPDSVADGFVHRDPRSDTLGWRVYAPAGLDLVAALGAEPADRHAYDQLRVAAMVPETGIELLPEETYILEAGFERLNGVDFKKGCYVGQEVTARMKHKTELKKGLVQVDVDGAAEPGTAVTANGKPAGTLFTQTDGKGLAHLRLDRAKGEMVAGTARVTYKP